MTRGLTVRDLAERYGGGKTAWSEYRSGARIVALGRLDTVLRDRVGAPRLQGLLAEARRLHDTALAAEAASRPAPGVAEALRQARADLAESGRLVESLLAMVALIRERVDESGAGWSGTAPAPGEAASQGTPQRPARGEAESPAAQEVRRRLDRAVGQLAAARSLEAAARRAVADAAAQRDAGVRRGVEIRSDAGGPARGGSLVGTESASLGGMPTGTDSASASGLPTDAGSASVPCALTVTDGWPVPDGALSGSGSGTPPDAGRAAPGLPAVPERPHPASAVVDAALRVQLVRIGNALKQQRADARWLWKRVERTRSGALASSPPYAVEGVAPERLDRPVAVPRSRAPAPTAVPQRRGRTALTVLGRPSLGATASSVVVTD
ncbi:hypothetical protein [Streptomyces crystallinus]|uniref:hypothetical protein n=1 Tax=Streptomyces crystallinus TaxID=68191 RepID=UPI0031D2B7FE